MDMLYKRVQDVGVIMGDTTKVVTESEVSIRKKLRGS